MPSDRPAAVFDFDGTLAQTLDEIGRILDDLAPRYGYPRASAEERERWRDLDALAIVRASGISPFRLPVLVREVRGQLRDRIATLPLVEGVEDALQQLARRGVRLGILTSNDADNVRALLARYDLDARFEFVCGGRTLFGKHRLLRKLLREFDLRPERLFYIGDETRDIDAARKSNVRSVAVTWGFNSRPALAAKQPDFIVERPAELVGIVGNGEP